MPEGRHSRRARRPHPGLRALRRHYGFRPDFCEGADPESKGLVENLVGYVKSDLMIPEELSVANLARDNELGLAWCDEVNAVVHSEICAIPAERLTKELEVMGTLPSLRATIGKLVVRKVDRLSCVRFGSARYSVPPSTSAPGRARRPRRPGPDHLLGRDHRHPRPRRPW